MPGAMAIRASMFRSQNSRSIFMWNCGRIFVTLGCLRSDGGAAARPRSRPRRFPRSGPMYFEHLTMRDGLSHEHHQQHSAGLAGLCVAGHRSGLEPLRRLYACASSAASAAISMGSPATTSGRWRKTRTATCGWRPRAAAWRAGTDATETFQQFRHDPQQPQSLASDSVRALLIDAKGLIWAGTEDRGLDVLDPKHGYLRGIFVIATRDAYSLPSDAIGALYADHEGRIWVGTDGGLSRYDSMTDDFVTYGEADERGQDARLRGSRHPRRSRPARFGSAPTAAVSLGSTRTADVHGVSA